MFVVRVGVKHCRWKNSHGRKVDGLIGGAIKRRSNEREWLLDYSISILDRLERERESKVWQGRVNGVILIKILCPFDFLLHSIIIDDERNFNLQTVIKIWIGTLINCCKDRLDSLKRERIISPISSKSQLKLQLTLFPERWILA